MSWYNLPPRRDEGDDRSIDEIQIRATEPHPAPTDGALGQAWEMVKEKPFETILLSFGMIIFGQGGGCNNVGNLGELIPTGDTDTSDTWGDDYGDSYDDGSSFGEGTQDYESWDPATELLGTFDPASIDLVNLPFSLGVLTDTAWLGIGLAAVLFIVALGLLMWVLRTAIEAGSVVFWLRYVRGQDATLNHTMQAKKFILPLLVTNILYGIAIGLGFLALVIPAVIIAIGLCFVSYVVIDKNLTYLDGLKASWRLTDGYKFDIFIFGILSGFLNMGGMLLCCVGMFVTNAIVMGATAIIYNRLAEPGNAYMPHSDILSAFD